MFSKIYIVFTKCLCAKFDVSFTPNLHVYILVYFESKLFRMKGRQRIVNFKVTVS